MTVRRLALAAVVALVAASPALAASKPAPAAPPAEEPKTKSLADTVKGLEKVSGLLTFYRSPEKLYLEVPAETLGAPLGFSTVLVNAAGDWLARGTDFELSLVAWERLGDRLMLSKKNLNFRADPSSPFHAAVETTFPDSPAFLADLIEVSDSPRPVLVDAKSLFGEELSALLPPESPYSIQGGDATLISLKAFPDNVVARVQYRVRRREQRGGGGGGQQEQGPFLRPGRLADGRYLAMTVDFNFFRLPEGDGYRPRSADERIGAFDVPHKDYTGLDDRDTAFRHPILRWDVRPSDPSAPVSPAIEPITFYVDSAVPPEWRALIHEGASWWNQAFEKVGIRNAVRTLDRPSDPSWDPADIHHSMIYWNLSDDLNFSGMAGPSVWDPRTGRVLKANVYLNGEFPSFALHRYLVYAWWRAPEPGAEAMGRPSEMLEARRDLRTGRKYCDRSASFSSQMAFARLVLQARGILKPGTPEADRYAREAFLELVAHEVGHAIGFPHNWKASLVASREAVESGKLTGRAATGLFSTSVMDYSPIYLAPKGEPQGDYFLREVGPYDELAVEYLYRPLAPQDEARALDAIAARAELEKGLIYDDGGLNDIDPTTNADDFGDDPLAFAETRLKVLREEVLPRLPELVVAEGHDYNLLRQALDSAVFSIALDYIDMTARHVGGQILLRRKANSPAAARGGPPPINPVAPAAQRRALEVLDRQLFAEGAFLLSADTLNKLKADLLFDWNYPWRYSSDYSVTTRIAGLYEAAFGTLFAPRRLARVLDNELRTAEPPFTLPELFGHLEATAFEGQPGVSLGVDRRALQRILVAHLAKLAVHPEKGTPAEASQVAASTLRSVARRLEKKMAGPAKLDGYTRAHYEDLAARIKRTLEAQLELPAG